jgi:NADH:ubiquinone oxidoreductase subunit D
VSKINPKKLRKLELWVEGVDVENEYTDIDNLFSDSVLTIEQKINSRKKITESLKRKVKKEKESINLPISTMVNIANKTIKNYVQQLDENTKGKLLRFLSSDVTEMESKYKVVKESVLNKLSNIKQNSEEEVVTKIDETISKITNEKFDKLNLFRLEELDNSI